MILTDSMLLKTEYIANNYKFDDQVDVLIEEMSELAKALLKNRRAKKGYTQEIIKETSKNVREELADVEIMLQQIIYLTESDEIVLKIINEKLNRQLERIKHEKE